MEILNPTIQNPGWLKNQTWFFEWYMSVCLVNGSVYKCHSITECICLVFKCFKPFYIGQFLSGRDHLRTNDSNSEFKTFGIQICLVFKYSELEPSLYWPGGLLASNPSSIFDIFLSKGARDVIELIQSWDRSLWPSTNSFWAHLYCTESAVLYEHALWQIFSKSNLKFGLNISAVTNLNNSPRIKTNFW